MINLDYLNQSSDERLESHKELVAELVAVFEEDFSKQSRVELVDVEIGGESLEMRLNDLFFSLLLTRSRFFDEGYIFSSTDLVNNVTDPSKEMKLYYDYNIEDLDYPIEVITKLISYSLEEITRNAWHINHILGNSVNIYDLIHLSMENEEVNDILHFESNENAQYSEIEQSVSDKCERLIEILKSDDVDTCLKNMLNSVSEKQFQQTFINISLKPDLHGKIISEPINTSFLRGMRNSQDFFINATGARKALVVNSTTVRTAGYLSRKLALLLMTTSLARDVEDCGSKELLEINVENLDIAKQFANRYYKTSLKDKKFKYCRNGEVKNMVGKTLHFASPITCGLSNSNKVCKRCYGRNTKNMIFHIGLAAAIILSNPIIQKLLSSKHLLQVITNMISLPEGLADFEIDKNELVATKDGKLLIQELVQDDLSDNVFAVAMSYFNPEAEDEDDSFIPIPLGDLELAVTEEALSKLNKTDMELEYKEGDALFRLDLDNNELSAPLKKVLKIIESGAQMSERATPAHLVEDLNKLLIESKITKGSLATEMIVRELARNPNNVEEKATDNVEFLRLTSAILNSGSASVALAFEQHHRLLEGLLFDKDQESMLDYLF